MRIGHRRRKASELYVQPEELARKLVKQMEDSKVRRGESVWVSHRYTVFVCPEDYGRLRDTLDALCLRLRRHLLKRAKAKSYCLADDLTVDVVADSDLKLGYFGIYAKGPGASADETPRLWEDERPQLAQAVGANGADHSAARRSLGRLDGSGLIGRRPVGSAASRVDTVRVGASRAAAEVAAGATSAAAGGTTAVLPRGEAEKLGLAWQVIVIKADGREERFTRSKILIGRSRDADFCIDDPEVSRKHAMVYWSDGEIVIEDLGSTNGTMVNGYPTKSAVLNSGDVVTIGGHRLTVEAR